MRAATWWIDRWRKSTAYLRMNLEEQGLYRNLLDAMWLFEGPIPNDPKTLVAASGGDATAYSRSSANVLKWFRLTDQGWVNDTAQDIITTVKHLHDVKALAGKAGAEARWQKHSKDNSKPDGKLHGKRMPPDPDPKVRTEGLKNNPSVRGRPKEPADPRVREFLEWFQEEYKRRRHGADYLVKWPRDAPLVKQMLHATSLDRLKLLAQAMLSDKCTEEFIANTDRGIGILSVKFNWLSDRIAEWETRNGRMNSNSPQPSSTR